MVILISLCKHGKTAPGIWHICLIFYIFFDFEDVPICPHEILDLLGLEKYVSLLKNSISPFEEDGSQGRQVQKNRIFLIVEGNELRVNAAAIADI